jgi:hypothetical protein
MKKFILLLLCSAATLQAAPDWSRGVEVNSPRENIFELDQGQFKQAVMAGRKHALFYPVTASELLIPYGPMKTFFESAPDDPVRKLLYQLGKVVTPFKSVHQMFSWLGLHDFPKIDQPENPNTLPDLSENEMALPMGATLMHTGLGDAMTFGCAACHTGDLFGVKVLGLTNRFPRANEFFDEGRKVAPYVSSFLFQDLLKTTDGERQMVVSAKNAINFVGTKKPAVLGLDTSLAQVALSLAKRGLDPYAQRNPHGVQRHNKLDKFVSDSKPAVWWNVKYKNRWLSDGSIVSGNPVHTNFLWNEIGRGTDLKRLEKWMLESQKTIDDLTAAVFATRPPRYKDFFGSYSIDVDLARRGEVHFVQSCQKCHGAYEKNWATGTETVQVRYHKKTPVIDVGTDPGRYLGMKEFSDDLNRLQISKTIGTVVEPQKGYVPPPLEGIWSRWPYFHNNSIPNLCALLTKASERPKAYWSHRADNRDTDYDKNCAGYPTGTRTPESWKQNKNYLYDTSKQGLSNSGHDEKIFLKDGKEIYSLDEKRELIEFLKTL